MRKNLAPSTLLGYPTAKMTRTHLLTNNCHRLHTCFLGERLHCSLKVSEGGLEVVGIISWVGDERHSLSCRMDCEDVSKLLQHQRVHVSRGSNQEDRRECT